MRAMLDMSTTAQIKDSLKLGGEVLGQIGRVGRLHKAQVEQAGFAVLKAPDIPSILVETAFISNPEEEAKLRDPEYQASWSRRWPPASSATSRRTRRWRATARCNACRSRSPPHITKDHHAAPPSPRPARPDGRTRRAADAHADARRRARASTASGATSPSPRRPRWREVRDAAGRRAARRDPAAPVPAAAAATPRRGRCRCWCTSTAAAG